MLAIGLKPIASYSVIMDISHRFKSIPKAIGVAASIALGTSCIVE
ncbi:MAG: hypothetical protein ACI9C4_002366 [Paraglaciecola sp.]|jgi:hypothetical protein